MNNKTVRIAVTVFGGWFGLHKYLDKHIGFGILYTLTGGIFGIGWIIDIVKACVFKTDNGFLQSVEPYSSFVDNGIYETCFDVVGTYYYFDSIYQYMKRNPKFSLSDVELLSLNIGKVYEFYPLNTNAVLTPEPENKHDENAVMVLIDNVLVGYVPADFAPFIKDLITKNKLLSSCINITGGNSKVIQPNVVYVSKSDFHIELKITYKK